MRKLDCLIILLHLVISGIHCNVTPVVMWHGMGYKGISKNIYKCSSSASTVYNINIIQYTLNAGRYGNIIRPYFFQIEDTLQNCITFCNDRSSCNYYSTIRTEQTYMKVWLKIEKKGRLIGDTCCFPFSLGSIKKMMETKLDGIYVKSLRIGDSIISDYESGFFIHPNKQIEEVCKQIKADTKLEKGYNALGFSQGGQFLRAVAQRCPNPPMKNLFSFGGQHQGIFGLPNCNSVSHKTCEIFRKLLNHVAYTNWTQNYLVQATYWHDPLQEDQFKMYSTFLADINNEQNLNTDYIKNLQNLERLILIKFTEDTIVQPKESQWFEFYVPGQDKLIQPLNESSLYIDNRLGLKDMMDSNKLIFLESKGNHLQFTDEWFNTHIIPLLSTG